ncbi:MAG: hypothetical protein UHH87_01055 [Akkermansia sp.]|nr:hypothetical protein [Akkermansia sp.]
MWLQGWLFQNTLDKLVDAWLNTCRMGVVSRIMQVVVMLLLPVFLAGASLEVPGEGCAHHCCQLEHCAPHAGELPDAGLHDHHHHRHGSISLLCDVGQRADRMEICSPWPMFSVVAPVDSTLQPRRILSCREPGRLPPRFGYVSPLRC